MNDTATPTIRVADIATSGQDRLDGPLLLDAIRAALDEHGAVRLSFRDMSSVTPTFVNEAMVPLLENASIDTLRRQVMIVDVTRHVGDAVRRCMEHGTRWNAGEFDVVNGIDPATMPLIEMEQDADGRYQPVAEPTIPDEANPFIRRHLDDLTIERMIEDEHRRPIDSDDSIFERMMKPTLRDHGITVIRCTADRFDHLADFACIAADLPAKGYDYRAKNAAPRSYRRR